MAITALFIANKFQEIYPPPTKDYPRLVHNVFTKEQMLKMETSILSTLQYDLNLPPAPIFLENYSRAMQFSDPAVLIYASFLIDLFHMKAEYLKFRPSLTVAVALDLSLQFHEIVYQKPEIRVWRNSLINIMNC